MTPAIAQQTETAPVRQDNRAAELNTRLDDTTNCPVCCSPGVRAIEAAWCGGPAWGCFTCYHHWPRDAAPGPELPEYERDHTAEYLAELNEPPEYVSGEEWL